eukprot:1492173-Karenia_brevis.AAC.1
MRFLEMPRGSWQHEIREGLRSMLWNRAAARRSEFDGVQAGVDRSSTLSLMQSRRTDDCHKGVLRSILVGAVRTGHNLYRCGLAEDDVCPFCDQGVPELLGHMWWECSAWQSIRRRHWLP